VARSGLYWMQRAMQFVMAACKVLLPDSLFPRESYVHIYSGLVVVLVLLQCEGKVFASGS
jgi:hypothetical protein